MRGLTSGKKGYEKWPKLFQKNFIFLSEYTTSVAEEHEPRGPEGPYRFKDRSVPVLVIKKWNGDTIVQQLGWAGAENRLEQILSSAIKKNGPVAPPKALRPLLKSYNKGGEHLKKGRTAAAIREFQAVLKAGGKKKVFREEPPPVMDDATERLEELERRCREEMEKVAATAQEDAAGARKAYGKLLRDYGGIKRLKTELRKIIKELPKE